MAKTRVKLDQLTVVGATTPGQVLTVQDSSGNVAAAAATGLANVVDDTTPQLGGDLDVNGKTITSASGSNADVPIQPDGSGKVNFADKLVKRPTFIDVAEQVVGATAGAMDMELGNVFTYTVSGTTTLSITHPPTAGYCGIITLILTNGGSATVNWPTGTKWPGGSGPTLTASGVDVIIFMTIDGGTTWRAQAAQLDSKAP